MKRFKTGRSQRSHIKLGRFTPGCLGVQLLPLLLAGLMVFSGCNSGTSSQPQSSGQVAGNWQFTMANPSDNSFLGGIQGGFLLQNNSAVTGAVVYSVMLPAQPGGAPTICNSGSAPMTGTSNGQ